MCSGLQGDVRRGGQSRACRLRPEGREAAATCGGGTPAPGTVGVLAVSLACPQNHIQTRVASVGGAWARDGHRGRQDAPYCTTFCEDGSVHYLCSYLNQLKRNESKSAVPQAHQPHFKCPRVTRRQGPPLDSTGSHWTLEASLGFDFKMDERPLRGLKQGVTGHFNPFLPASVNLSVLVFLAEELPNCPLLGPL